MVDPQLQQLLDAYNSDTLAEIAKAGGIIFPGGKKPGKQKLIEMMAEEFFTRQRVTAALDKLSRSEHAVLVRLQQAGNTLPSSSFQRLLERSQLAEAPPAPARGSYGGYEGSPHRPNSKVYNDLLARLTYHGLVFSQLSVDMTGSYSYKLKYDPGTTILIPEVVARHLPPPPPLVETLEKLNLAKTVTGDGQLLLRNLYLYWDFVRRTPVDLLQSGMVGKRHLKAINSVLLVTDPTVDDAGSEDQTAMLYFYRQLLSALKLLKVSAGRLQTLLPTGNEGHFWALAPFDQMVRLLQAWCQLAATPELDATTSRFGANASQARTRLLELLNQRGTSWNYPADLMEQLQNKDRNYLFPQRSAAEAGKGNYVFYQYGYYGDSKSILKLLDGAEEKLIRFTLEQILAPFGLAELGFENADSATWSAARLTPNGQAVLKKYHAGSSHSLKEAKPDYGVQQADEASAHEGRVVVQPNFQILAMGPVPISTLAFLDRFAERRKADRTVFEYYLTRQSVYGGLQDGLTASEIENALRNYNDGTLPQNVQRSLHEWGAHHDRIVFRSDVTLLQTATTDLLNLLLEDAKTGRYLERGLTPEVALLNKGQINKLQQALLDKAMLPAVSDDQPSAADHSVTISPDGAIRPIHSVPNLHLTGRLARIAEEGKQGWKLTQRSVRKAAGNRKKVEELLAELNKLQRSDLPEALVANIKKWGLYYGTAAIETLTLIEFSDRNTLNEVLKHPQLKDKLAPYKAGERAVVTVEAKDLKQVRQILSELGVESK